MEHKKKIRWGRKMISKEFIIEKTVGNSLAKKVIVLEETDSTNRYLKELAAEGAEEGTVVIAERQSHGRGRLGRSFFSPEEKGIYMSVLLRPEIELQKSVRITSMAAVAVARAIERVCGVKAQIKWVNDVFLNNRKVCGILTEAGFDQEGKRLSHAVLGIGVNVGTMEFPEELRTIATSVCNECGKEVSREELIVEIVRELAYWYPSLQDGSFLKESRERSLLLGKDILVVGTTGQESFGAKAVDLDDMGHLLIEKDGKIQLLHSGEVSIRL